MLEPCDERVHLGAVASFRGSDGGCLVFLFRICGPDLSSLVGMAVEQVLVYVHCWLSVVGVDVKCCEWDRLALGASLGVSEIVFRHLLVFGLTQR